jgi:hypothetical protein
MTLRDWGFVLIWLGTIALVGVLQHRVRNGAWRIDAESVHPMGRWAVSISAAGMVAALAGVVMMML